MSCVSTNLALNLNSSEILLWSRVIADKRSSVVQYPKSLGVVGMFIKAVTVGEKTYDLHLEFVGGFYDKGKPTDMGYLIKELCYPSGENAKYIQSEGIKSQHSMTKNKLK